MNCTGCPGTSAVSPVSDIAKPTVTLPTPRVAWSKSISQESVPGPPSIPPAVVNWMNRSSPVPPEAKPEISMNESSPAPPDALLAPTIMSLPPAALMVSAWSPT